MCEGSKGVHEQKKTESWTTKQIGGRRERVGSESVQSRPGLLDDGGNYDEYDDDNAKKKKNLFTPFLMLSNPLTNICLS